MSTDEARGQVGASSASDHSAASLVTPETHEPPDLQELNQRKLAGLELPTWVGSQLEHALHTCEKGFDAAWLLSDRTDDLVHALREADLRVYDVEVLSRMELSRDELEVLLMDTLFTLQLLRRAMPDPEELEAWASALSEARQAVRHYLVQRQYFKLRLSSDMRIAGI